MRIVNDFSFFTTSCVFLLLSTLFFLLASTQRCEFTCEPANSVSGPINKQCGDLYCLPGWNCSCDDTSLRDCYIVKSDTPNTMVKVMVQIGTNASGPFVSLETAKDVFEQVNAIYNGSKIQFQPHFIFLDSDISYTLGKLISGNTESLKYISFFNYGCNLHDPKQPHCDFINTFWLDIEGSSGEGTFGFNQEVMPTITVRQDRINNRNNRNLPIGAYTMAHELGHTLGLWHVDEQHIGKNRSCDNVGCCGIAGQLSNETDDFCSDTDPLPFFQGGQLKDCKPPNETLEDCYGNVFPQTSVGNLSNLMLSLAPDASGCKKLLLTPMQWARMHCHLDYIILHQHPNITKPLCGDSCGSAEECCTSEGATVSPASCCGVGTCCSAIINRPVPLNYSGIPTVKCCNEAEVCSLVPAADHNNSYPVCCPEGETPVFQPRFDFACDSGGSTVEPLFFLALFVLLFTIFQ